MRAIITVKKLSKAFGGQPILNKISFDVGQGEVIGIIGESGVGKTTLLRMLMGVLNSDSGTISYRFKRKLLSVDILKKEKVLFYKFLGFSTQDCSFYPHLTVYDNVVLYGALNGLQKKSIPKKIKDLLKFVNLSNKQDEPAANLSSGMQKRLDIACSLVHQPKIIFLDEPAAHLDKKNRNVIWKLVKRMNKKGMTVVISSHFLSELKKVCDRMYLLRNKKIIQQNV